MQKLFYTVYTATLIIITPLAYAKALLTFQLEKGDFLFQDLNCGNMCDSIDSVTYGYKNTYVSHVAMIVNTHPPTVIEAISNGVETTPLHQFLNRSLDNNNKPRVMVGRLKPKYSYLIQNAIINAQNQIGKSYNNSFIPAKGKSFYCSELLDYSFQRANGNQPFFHHHPMDFTNGKSSDILPLWESYYQQLHTPVPQGLPGTNPGAMSRESMIQIIYFYGALRQH